MDQNRIVHEIPCDDVADRDRAMVVIGTPGRLTFVAPPGEVAHVDPRDYELLRQAMRDSLVVAWKPIPERRPAAGGSPAEPQLPHGGSAGAEDEHAGTAVPGSGTLGPHTDRRAES